MKIVSIDTGPSLVDIPAMLEQTAIDIRRGDHGKVQTCCFVLKNDDLDIKVFGFGQVPDSRAQVMAWIGLLHLGIDKLTEMYRVAANRSAS